jgi:hypothetical protein
VNPLTTGESILGTLTATFGSTVFNPSAVTSLNIYWGSNESLPINPAMQPSVITGGTFLATAAVIPEPSSALLLCVAAALTASRRRKE